MEIYQQVLKYGGIEETLLGAITPLFQNNRICAISPLFHNIFNIAQSDMSKNGYFDVFQRVPWTSRLQESTVLWSPARLLAAHFAFCFVCMSHVFLLRY